MEKLGVKTKFLIAFISVFVIGNSLYAVYCPYTGRFLSRDPIEEPGFQAIAQTTGDVALLNALVNKEFEPEYTFVGNDPVNKWDYLGLKWKVKRQGSNLADARRESSVDDTIEKLASKVRLNESEALKWLRNEDGSKVSEADLKTKCSFKVPNTFVIGVGDITSGVLNKLGGYFWITMWSGKVQNALVSRGVNVIVLENKSGHRDSDFARAAIQSDVAGYALFGHGYRKINSWYDWRTDSSDRESGGLVWDESNVLSYRQLLLHPFKYSLGINYHCYPGLQPWGSLSVNQYGKSNDMIKAMSGPRAIGWWGSWDGLIGEYFDDKD